MADGPRCKRRKQANPRRNNGQCARGRGRGPSGRRGAGAGAGAGAGRGRHKWKVPSEPGAAAPLAAIRYLAPPARSLARPLAPPPGGAAGTVTRARPQLPNFPPVRAPRGRLGGAAAGSARPRRDSAAGGAGHGRSMKFLASPRRRSYLRGRRCRARALERSGRSLYKARGEPAGRAARGTASRLGARGCPGEAATGRLRPLPGQAAFHVALPVRLGLGRLRPRRVAGRAGASLPGCPGPGLAAPRPLVPGRATCWRRH